MSNDEFRAAAALLAMHAILNRVVNIEAAELAADAFAVADAMVEKRVEPVNGEGG